ncbi:MAG TPA: L-2-hydroxyglutarate oxidase, partial [Acidimicrobiales bacterium]|nr:L-2-hydroxyglutarate oxidase [Acidimicrobiales bacterium]
MNLAHRAGGSVDDAFCVVGGGIVGLALARELLVRRPDSAVTVLEKEAVVGAHQTGHNSGVVHAGLYYAPGSLKALLCRRGRSLLREFCAEHRIEVLECGKLVIATRQDELERLHALRRRAETNEVPDLRLLGRSEIAEIEPHAVGIAALHSPRTAIVDYGSVARALAADVARRGGRVLTNAEAVGFTVKGDWVDVHHSTGAERARRVVVCAGLQADRVSALAGDVSEPGIVGFRGEYLRLVPRAAELVRGLIYPLADPRLPFLGIHVTRKID